MMTEPYSQNINAKDVIEEYVVNSSYFAKDNNTRRIIRFALKHWFEHRHNIFMQYEEIQNWITNFQNRQSKKRKRLFQEEANQTEEEKRLVEEIRLILQEGEFAIEPRKGNTTNHKSADKFTDKARQQMINLMYKLPESNGIARYPYRQGIQDLTAEQEKDWIYRRKGQERRHELWFNTDYKFNRSIGDLVTEVSRRAFSFMGQLFLDGLPFHSALECLRQSPWNTYFTLIDESWIPFPLSPISNIDEWIEQNCTPDLLKAATCAWFNTHLRSNPRHLQHEIWHSWRLQDDKFAKQFVEIMDEADPKWFDYVLNQDRANLRPLLINHVHMAGNTQDEIQRGFTVFSMLGMIIVKAPEEFWQWVSSTIKATHHEIQFQNNRNKRDKRDSDTFHELWQTNWKLLVDILFTEDNNGNELKTLLRRAFKCWLQVHKTKLFSHFTQGKSPFSKTIRAIYQQIDSLII